MIRPQTNAPLSHPLYSESNQTRILHAAKTCVCLLVAGCILALPAMAHPERQQKPNFLVILSDDQAFDTIAALGNREIQTPNLDQLVARGTTFTHAYNMGSWSGAVCVPSRTMLMTGRFLWPVQQIARELDQERERLWPELMKRAGYKTYFTGKWHLNVDATKVFDVAKHVRPGMPNQTPAGYDRPKEGQPDPWSPDDRSAGGFWKGGTHWSEVVRNDALEFLNAAAGDEQPFFMYVAFNAPHDPRQSPREFLDRYPLESISVPTNYLPEYPFKEAIGCSKDLRDERLAPFPRTEHAVRVHRREYYAIITHMDAQIGTILDALEQSPFATNTFVVFTSDHGLAVGRHGFMGKQNLYDHSVRVPFIVAGMTVAKGHRLPTPIYLQDLMPTVLDLAGIPKPDWVQFHSLLPLLQGRATQSPYDAIYGAYLDLQRSVTLDGYKLIVYPRLKKLRLYNLNRDPHELVDLADRSETREIKARLIDALLEQQQVMHDPLDLKSLFGESH